MLIDGNWRSSERGELLDVHTPIDGSIVARAQMATVSDVISATKAAKEKRGINELPGRERIEIFERAVALMEKHRDEFVHVLQIEAGKTKSDAKGEFDAAVQRLRLSRQEAERFWGELIPGEWNSSTKEKMALTIREPVGVVAAIIPFNYPLFIAAAKIVPALLAGNSVVIKPSSSNPISAILLTRVLESAGVPKGSMNLITGRGEESGDALVKSENVDMINFTGSTPVGKRISQMAVMKRLHLELGGKAYALVLEDADLDLAAAKCVYGSLKFAGQRCDAVSAILATEPIAETLSRKIVSEVDRWKLGDPRDTSVTIGPVISPKAAAGINDLVMDAVSKGAELLRGGKFQGTYFEPTVLGLCSPACKNRQRRGLWARDQHYPLQGRARGSEFCPPIQFRPGVVRLYQGLLPHVARGQGPGMRRGYHQRLSIPWRGLFPIRRNKTIRAGARRHRLQHRGDDQPQDHRLQFGTWRKRKIEFARNTSAKKRA